MLFKPVKCKTLTIQDHARGIYQFNLYVFIFTKVFVIDLKVKSQSIQ